MNATNGQSSTVTASMLNAVTPEQIADVLPHAANQVLRALESKDKAGNGRDDCARLRMLVSRAETLMAEWERERILDAMKHHD